MFTLLYKFLRDIAGLETNVRHMLVLPLLGT